MSRSFEGKNGAKLAHHSPSFDYSISYRRCLSSNQQVFSKDIYETCSKNLKLRCVFFRQGSILTRSDIHGSMALVQHALLGSEAILEWAHDGSAIQSPTDLDLSWIRGIQTIPWYGVKVFSKGSVLLHFFARGFPMIVNSIWVSSWTLGEFHTQFGPGILLSLAPLDNNDDCLLTRVCSIQQMILFVFSITIWGRVSIWVRSLMMVSSALNIRYAAVVATHTLQDIIGVDIQLYSLYIKMSTMFPSGLHPHSWLSLTSLFVIVAFTSGLAVYIYIYLYRSLSLYIYIHIYPCTSSFACWLSLILFRWDALSCCFSADMQTSKDSGTLDFGTIISNPQLPLYIFQFFHGFTYSNLFMASTPPSRKKHASPISFAKIYVQFNVQFPLV